MKRQRHVIIAVLLGLSIGVGSLTKAMAADKRPEPRELLAAALQAAATIDDADEKEDALLRIIRAQILSGDMAGAEKSAKSLTTDLKKGFARSSLAAGYARAGDLKRATAMADAADPRTKSAIYEELVGVEVEKGNIAEAKVLQSKAVDPFYAARADLRIVVAQAAAGDIAGAKAAVATMRGPADVKVQAYVDLAEALVKAENVAGANEMIKSASGWVAQVPDYVRPLSVAAIAGAQVKVGAARAALSTANAMTDPRARALVLSHIAEAQAESGDVAGHRETAKLLTGDDQARQQVMLARAQMKAGDQASARKSLAAARSLADRIEIPTLRAFVYETLLATQVELGDAAAAAESARSQKDPIVRSYSLTAVTRALVEKPRN